MSLLMCRLSPPGGVRKPPTLTSTIERKIRVNRPQNHMLLPFHCWSIRPRWWHLAKHASRFAVWRRSVAEVGLQVLQVNNSDDLSSVNCPLPRAAYRMWGWKTSRHLKSHSEGLDGKRTLIFKRVCLKIRLQNPKDNGQTLASLAFPPRLACYCLLIFVEFINLWLEKGIPLFSLQL